MLLKVMKWKSLRRKESKIRRSIRHFLQYFLWLFLYSLLRQMIQDKRFLVVLAAQ